MIRHGTRLYGEKNPAAKLSWEQVDFIRGNNHLAPKYLAAKFGIHRNTVSDIRRGIIWKEKWRPKPE